MAIALTLESLVWRQTDTGWEAALSGAQCFGKPLTLRVDTRSVPESIPPPEISPDENLIIGMLLPHLPELLKAAEEAFRGHYSGLTKEDLTATIHDPHVWISREILKEERTVREENDGGTFDPPSHERLLWTLVIGQEQAPDYGTHVEFDGLTYLGIWAGD